jgi:hypothetical protein
MNSAQNEITSGIARDASKKPIDVNVVRKEGGYARTDFASSSSLFSHSLWWPASHANCRDHLPIAICELITSVGLRKIYFGWNAPTARLCLTSRTRNWYPNI